MQRRRERSKLLFKAKYRPMPASVAAIAPVMLPSIVLLGLTLGASLFLPNHLPPKRAKESQTQVEMQATAKMAIQSSRSESSIIIRKGTVGYTSTARPARVPLPLISGLIIPAIKTANTARKNSSTAAELPTIRYIPAQARTA